MISKETSEEFKKIIKEESGKELTDNEALEASNNLVGFFDLLLKIDHRNKEK